MNDLQLVNDRLEALINRLSALARKEMARSIRRKLRQPAAEYETPAGAKWYAV